MTPDFFSVKLQTVIKTMPVERVNEILSTFSCPLNDDIEHFLKERAVEFSNKGIARTHLVMRGEGDGLELLGYYTLANKILTIAADSMSKTTRSRIERFGVIDTHTGLYNVPTPLIAQLGRNFSECLLYSIAGEELLEAACSKVADIQAELGGRLVYIECENTSKLIDFYSRNNFRIMDSGKPKAGGLIQMIRFL
ncbi:MAG: N-acetyltransferase [Clostridiales Family XIII bacterium]|nr:N-acetyltransferase [Clostridiales Family XIII bacterium]